MISNMFANNCSYCGESNPPSNCSRCKAARYCNRECQSLDWRRHKIEDCVSSSSSTNNTPVKKWKYSAPFKPYSYWQSLGHGNQYARDMMEFQGQFTEAVNGIRSSSNCYQVIMNYPHESTADGKIIFHDNALLPHWREFANACKLAH